MDNCLDAFHIRRGELPRLGIGQILVTDACQIHRFALCVAEMVRIEQSFDRCFYIGKLAERFAVVVGQFAAGRHFPAEVFLR